MPDNRFFDEQNHRCETCIHVYWYTVELKRAGNEIIYRCRANPPTRLARGSIEISGWPEVGQNDWCSHYAEGDLKID